MRIRYRILWIEDDPDYIKELGAKLTEYLDSLGFELDIVSLRNGSNKKKLKFGDFEYDLILADYNLDDHNASQIQTGDEIIELIRADKIITEALLYSSKPGVKLAENLGNVERISYHLGRKDLPDKIQRIINLGIRKVQDVNNMRGLVIAEVIDLEIKMKAILKKFFTTNADKTKQQELIDKKVESITEALERVKKCSPEKILNFIEDHHTVDDHCKALLRLIKYSIDAVDATLPEAKSQKKVLTTMRKKLDKMRDEVIRLRNIMAHVEEQRKSGKIILKSKNGKKTIEITTKKCVEIRQALRQHSAHLEKIADHFFKKPVPV